MSRQKIIDEFTPVRKIGPNRYELKDGRVVSRQRIEQLRHPDRLSQRRSKWWHKSAGNTLVKKVSEK